MKPLQGENNINVVSQQKKEKQDKELRVESHRAVADRNKKDNNTW